MKKILGVFIWLLLTEFAYASEDISWIRYPNISPDGTKIAFGYKGDIYVMSSKGGIAAPLTIHESHDMMPVWSKDGKNIAFASDRFGNFDVFIISAEGGNPKRLTFHSANDYPQDFSPDNQQVLFTSARNIQSTNCRFYSPRLFNNLYKVNIQGGRPILVSGAGMNLAHYNFQGNKVVFQDRKGYEDLLRKHHTSSVTRDIWIVDLISQQYKKVSQFEGEDLEPVFGSDGESIYFLSEKSGTLNIWKSVNNELTQITQFNTHPIRHLSISKSNTLCFTFNGNIFIQEEHKEPLQLNVQIHNDGRKSPEKILSVTNQITQFAVSPNGKEIAFINRGEVFVTSVEGTQTKRITNTPEQERSVEWAPDGRSLIYASERGTSWDIYSSTIIRKAEPYFYASTILKEEAIIASNEEEFQPHYSPDGKEIAYVAERNALKVFNLQSKESRTLLPHGRNYSYSDGDWDFSWSPDGKYILSDDAEGSWYSGNVALIHQSGRQAIIHPHPSGYGQSNVKWALKGKAMSWTNAKEGRKSMAYQGSREVDIYIGFFNQEAYEQYILNKDEYALIKEKLDKEKKDDEDKNKKSIRTNLAGSKSKVSSKKDADTDTLLLNHFKNRIKRLTINSSSISDYALTSDGNKVYYLSSFEKGFDLWVTEPRTRDTKILAKLGAGGGQMQLSQDGKTIFVIKDGTLAKIDENGKVENINISGEMTLNSTQERKYILDHAYRQVIKKFYDPKLHGVDWKMMYDNYASLLPNISNNYDFQELLSEFLGELNASHTGGRYSPSFSNGDNTATLGLLFDETYSGIGLKVTEVIRGGPLNKAGSKIQAGDLIKKIDGQTITDSTDWNALLNRKSGKNTLITFSNSTSSKEDEVVVKPISLSEENSLMYKRWLANMNEMTQKLSNGKVGYVHVSGMNDGSYREVLDEVLGQHYDKKALIVDTRFNGGGWLHDDLKTFLSGDRYLDFSPQGHLLKDGEPMGRWTKPSCVLMSEGNYSDAFIFPYVYKQAHIGKCIGMPVPGTGTAVWWETQIDPTMVFGIPMIATIGKEKRPTENFQLEPDVLIPLRYEDFLQGKDTQLESAVKEMLKQIK
ncbi:MAG: PD40 domain-containing protein [Chitinophagaceae bacterium]|nr:PD40 domain-containing protein [Chitinophagaceae bacterium]